VKKKYMVLFVKHILRKITIYPSRFAFIRWCDHAKRYPEHPGAVQEYLVNEIQEVYRLQGVKINDKHIGSGCSPDDAEKQW